MTRSHAVPAPATAPRLRDVAERAGVSIATASRALTGRGGVSGPVAARVRRISTELGYVANPHARTLAGGATPTVGLMVHQIEDPYFSEIASGVIEVADGHGLIVQVCHSGREPETELRQIRQLLAQRVGAIVVAGSGYTDPRREAGAKAELARFAAAGGRVAVIGRHFLGADAVLPANEAGGRAVAAHLLSLGHRRIGVVAGPAGLTTVADRLAGVAAAVRDAGLDFSRCPVVHGDFSRDGGRAAAERIRREYPDTTAIIALSDVMAIGVLAGLRHNGIPVPERISVAGFDDVSVAADLAPALTTVRLPLREMGRTALALALKPHAARPRRSPAAHRLVERDSTGPPPEAGPSADGGTAARSPGRPVSDPAAGEGSR